MFALFFYCAISIPIVVLAMATDEYKKKRKHSMILFIVYIVGYMAYIFSCMNYTVID